MKTPHELRLRLAKSIVAYHERTGSEVWWQHSLKGAEGQCRGAGLISNVTHREPQPHMTNLEGLRAAVCILPLAIGRTSVLSGVVQSGSRRPSD